MNLRWPSFEHLLYANLFFLLKENPVPCPWGGCQRTCSSDHWRLQCLFVGPSSLRPKGWCLGPRYHPHGNYTGKFSWSIYFSFSDNLPNQVHYTCWFYKIWGNCPSLNYILIFSFNSENVFIAILCGMSVNDLLLR